MGREGKRRWDGGSGEGRVIRGERIGGSEEVVADLASEFVQRV